MKVKNFKKAYTLVEVLITVSIFAIIIVSITAFQRDVFSLNRKISSGLNTQYEVKKIIKPFANEVRSVERSESGAFPIKEASTSTFSFYSDIDNDGAVELVKYFLDGTNFKKGIIEPAGNPVAYDPEDEDVTYIINDVLISEPIFLYFDSTYTGSTTSASLASPVAPLDVRLVKVNLVVDKDGDGINPEAQVSTQITLRNLKDNY